MGMQQSLGYELGTLQKLPAQLPTIRAGAAIALKWISSSSSTSVLCNSLQTTKPIIAVDMHGAWTWSHVSLLCFSPEKVLCMHRNSWSSWIHRLLLFSLEPF